MTKEKLENRVYFLENRVKTLIDKTEKLDQLSGNLLDLIDSVAQLNGKKTCMNNGRSELVSADSWILVDLKD
jgi:hypothetical protein